LFLRRIVESNVCTEDFYVDHWNDTASTIEIKETSLSSLLVLNSKNLTTLIAPNLETINGRLYIASATKLKRLWLPKLREVKTITIIDSPSLSEVSDNFYSGNNAVTITARTYEPGVIHEFNIKNTALKSIAVNCIAGTGGPEDGNILIADNPYLENFTMTGLVNGPSIIEIQDNGSKARTRTKINFPDLQLSAYIGLSRVSDFSLPQLRNLTGTIEIWKSMMTTIELPSLIGAGAIRIISNENLERIEMPAFEKIGRSTVRGDEGDGDSVGIWDNGRLTTWVAPPRFRSGSTFLQGKFDK
jgi:hypothetical protein